MGGDGQTRTAVDGRKSEATTTRWFLSELIVWDDEEERGWTGSCGVGVLSNDRRHTLRGRNRKRAINCSQEPIDSEIQGTELGKGRD